MALKFLIVLYRSDNLQDLPIYLYSVGSGNLHGRTIHIQKSLRKYFEPHVSAVITVLILEYDTFLSRILTPFPRLFSSENSSCRFHCGTESC